MKTRVGRLWKYLQTPEGRSVFVLSLVSGVFAAAYKAADNAMVHRYITSDDNLIAASTYLIIGGWVGVITRIFYSFIFGHRFIDDSFKGLLSGSRRMHKLAATAGSLSALGTLCILRGNQGADPGVIVALGSFSMVFMVKFDKKKGQHLGTNFLLLSSLVLIGCVLASYQGSWSFPWFTMGLVLLVASPINGYNTHLGQEGGRDADSILFPFWRFVWLAATGTVGVLAYSLIRDKMDILQSTMGDALTTKGMWIVVVLVMLFFFFSDTLETRAKKEKGVSMLYVILIGLAAQIFLASPITIAGEMLSPGIFGGYPHDMQVWIVRIVGMLLVIWGVFHLRKKFPISTEK